MKIEKKQQIRGPSENPGRTKSKWYRKKWLRVTAVCLVTVLVVSEFVIHYTAQQEIQTDFGPETLLDAQIQEVLKDPMKVLEAFKDAKGMEPVPIGSYRGFTMSVAFDSMWKTYTLTLKGRMTHRVELGSDARGNLVRIENALDKMPERLRSVQEQLENLYNQQAAAKAEVGKPFPQEQELAAKTARLIELDMELNLDGKGQPQPEQAIAKSTRPSVLDRLKASPVHGAPEKPHKKEMEAR